ncbi:MAG: AmmeMemoRadiSam system protein B, partial [Armatimonadetes bacterium]|nr:AmmeMemoRadiSam system protein B [Armatimonadota bacterium]
ADLFVVLGIAHSSSVWPDPPPLATLTRLDFDTPLGTVHTDRDFVARLAGHYAAAGGDREDLFRDELVHRAEHSVEFQTLFLQHLHGGREFRIVPILLGSLHEFYDCPEEVTGRDGLGPLLSALAAATAEHDGEVCLVAGADLAHVGPRFGAEEPVQEGDLDAIAERDLDALRRFVDGGGDAFFEHFAADGNARNVCSVSNLYVLRALLPDASAELLRWDVAYDPSQSVSFAALALR